MKPLLHASLVNDPFKDPVVYVDILWERRGILFDLGCIHRLPPVSLLKVSDIFVSHTHIDHFIGFDHFLRIVLNREKSVRLYGPKGMISNVAGKLAAYTWNLVDRYNLVIEVYEIDGPKIRRGDFICARGFAMEEKGEFEHNGVILDEPHFTVSAVPLSHGIISMAYSMAEKEHINISKDALERRGYQVGPWLKDLKEKVRRRDLTGEVMVPTKDGEEAVPVAKLEEAIITISRGQKISYVVDVLYNEENLAKIVGLVKDSDVLFIEAFFSEGDSVRAGERYHLTSRQAGEIAAQAGVKELRLLHHSPRYKDAPNLLKSEAMKYFRRG
ncbi:MAG: ribonuclease Z [Nitrospinota bacterium]|nr:ribonuclease Z [Nitrospinota bacterium]